jgi:hypothetical protein
MAPIEEMASIFGRGGGQKINHVSRYYAPDAGHNPAQSCPLTDLAQWVRLPDIGRTPEQNPDPASPLPSIHRLKKSAIPRQGRHA